MLKLLRKLYAQEARLVVLLRRAVTLPQPVVPQFLRAPPHCGARAHQTRSARAPRPSQCRRSDGRATASTINRPQLFRLSADEGAATIAVNTCFSYSWSGYSQPHARTHRLCFAPHSGAASRTTTAAYETHMSPADWTRGASSPILARSMALDRTLVHAVRVNHQHELSN